MVGLDESATYIATITVWPGATSATGTYPMRMTGGGQYQFEWMASTDPAESDQVLVVRQIA